MVAIPVITVVAALVRPTAVVVPAVVVPAAVVPAVVVARPGVVVIALAMTVARVRAVAVA